MKFYFAILSILFVMVKSNVFLVRLDDSRSTAWIRGRYSNPPIFMRRLNDRNPLSHSKELIRQNEGHNNLDKMIAFVGTIAGGLALYEIMGKLAI